MAILPNIYSAKKSDEKMEHLAPIVNRYDERLKLEMQSFEQFPVPAPRPGVIDSHSPAGETVFRFIPGEMKILKSFFEANSIKDEFFAADFELPLLNGMPEKPDNFKSELDILLDELIGA
jgi:hypothetical protein